MIVSKAVWLITCWLWHTAVVEATPTTPRPLPAYPVSMAQHGKIYLVVREGPENLGSPGYFRSQGGISQALLHAPRASEHSIGAQDLAGVEMLFEADDIFARRDAWMEIVNQGGPDHAQRVWIYCIATGPNLRPVEVPDALPNARPVTRVLGGLPWSQIVRWTALEGHNAQVRDLFQHMVENDGPVLPAGVDNIELSWMHNDDYNPAWQAYGAVLGIPPDVFENLEGLTEHDVARDLMRLVTSSRLVPDEQSRQVLRGLLDWDMDAEPERDFPLLRYGQPTMLEAAALSRIPWERVQIPPSLQVAVVSGVIAVGQCSAALDAVRKTFEKGSKGRRGVAS
ncbi:hypothetical protein NOR_07970 [Metarhizium rileyi]|uniref:Uncharacterized protein n=1 Tax=Metarhizium rileyi (strain RCEF 4871) TaxID=1649241 RepID=A0A166X3M8_METRR|nr:hypothetical protein NOR_07970 [Metarhizium rileyi RCEF 4871]